MNELMPRRRPRRLFAALAVAGGAALLVFEIRRFGVTGGEKWFWLAVGAMLVVLGLVQLLAPNRDQE